MSTMKMFIRGSISMSASMSRRKLRWRRSRTAQATRRGGVAGLPGAAGAAGPEAAGEEEVAAPGAVARDIVRIKRTVTSST